MNLFSLLYSSWRNHFARATQVKFNSFLLVPFMDDFPSFLVCFFFLSSEYVHKCFVHLKYYSLVYLIVLPSSYLYCSFSFFL